MKTRYKIIISNKNLYKEIELSPETEYARIGTEIDCDFRLHRDLFFEPVTITLNKKDDSSISAGIALHGINKYFEKLYSVNSRSKTQINNIYQSVRSLDNACSRKIQNQVNIMDGHKANMGFVGLFP